MFVLGFPAPVGGLDRAQWKVKDVQDDFEAWARFFHVGEPAFEDVIYQLAVAWMGGRDWLARPFAKYVSWSGCEQPWRMFVGPVRTPTRLQIQTRRRQATPDAWETLYEQHSPEHRWHDDLFAEERLRSQIARWPWPGYELDYQLGCEHIATLAFAELPEVDDVRCQFWSQPTLTPDQLDRGGVAGGQWVDERVQHRPPPGASK